MFGPHILGLPRDASEDLDGVDIYRICQLWNRYQHTRIWESVDAAVREVIPKVICQHLMFRRGVTSGKAC